jgi:hypothetical protein
MILKRNISLVMVSVLLILAIFSCINCKNKQDKYYKMGEYYRISFYKESKYMVSEIKRSDNDKIMLFSLIILPEDSNKKNQFKEYLDDFMKLDYNKKLDAINRFIDGYNSQK